MLSGRYAVHRLRQVIDLRGTWDFAWLGDARIDNVRVNDLDFEESMPIPGCFDALPKYMGQRGLVAYRRRVWLQDESRLRWLIDGAHHYCQAYVNGEFVGEHSGGFTRFHFDLGRRRAEHLDLVMLLDNRFDAERVPLHLPHFDWYHYGGITRGTQLQVLTDVVIERVRIDTLELLGPTLSLRCEYTKRAGPSTVPFAIHVGERRLWFESLVLDSGSGAFEREFSLPGAKLWSPRDPNLHEVRVVLGQDDYTVRVGLRKLSIVDRKLCINNEPCFLQGVNRHEVHPDFGHAVPPELQLKDLQLIKQLGANFIRGSHYPQDPRLLDWCDELGLLVWNEAIGWQHRVEELVNPRFVQAQAAHISEMLAMSENHACVIMWGILNESASHQQLGRAAFEALFQHLRKLDPSRPVTFATCHPHDDLCLDLVDIVSVNTYPGWYVDSLEKVPAKLSELLQELRAKEPHKPILVSEIGAGALFGCHAREAPHWTEEYQAQLLDSVLDTLLTKAPDCAGICIWQFTDCRVSNAVPGVLGRPRGFNNKGLLDEYRRPKLAFETVMKWFGRPS